MKKIVIATSRLFNPAMLDSLRRKVKIDIVLLRKRDDLTFERLNVIKPHYIFFLHWSWRIPDVIFKNYKCVVFHMTDLPYGRGGSPLQNLIVRGHKKTKISAIKVVNKLDAGPVYCKHPLLLSGTAETILKRASLIIFKNMMPIILRREIIPKSQIGKPVIFKRRNPEDGDLGMLNSLESIYDHIRMLDAPGYPKAFIRFGSGVVYFSKARLNKGKLVAEANFICQK